LTTLFKEDEITFRAWHYVTTIIKYSVSNSLSFFCVNFNYNMFIINCAFVKAKMLNIKIKKCLLISLKDIDVTKYILDE